MPEISIVVPVFHNEETLPALFAALEEHVPGPEFEYVFVDDGSKDGSWGLLERYAASRPNVRAVKLSRNFGSFVACQAGLTYVTGDAAVLISADLQDPPELIGRLVEKWRGGNEVVLATRGARADPLLQRILAGVYYRIMRRFAFPDMPVGGFDFVLIDRKVIDSVTAIREKNTTLMGLILWTGFRRASISYTRRERPAGRSMWTLAKKVRYFVDSIVAFSDFPIRAAQLLGVLLSVTGFLYAALVIVLRLRSNIVVPGWSALMVLVLVVGGIQLLMLGVMGEYLWRTLDETKRRPLFIVDRVVPPRDEPGS